MVGWAEETTLDVEWAHVMAPKANILLVETPVSETEGVQGFPEIVQSENYVIDNHLAGVISQSFGATEETFPSTSALLALRSANLERRVERRDHARQLGRRRSRPTSSSTSRTSIRTRSTAGRRPIRS